MKKCKTEDCDLKQFAKGFCQKHYKLQYNSEDVKRRKHNKLDSPEYKSWAAMKSRCNSKTNRAYEKYGGRGITVCDEWSDFVGFYKDMGDRPDGTTLDRIDNDKGYYKDNCRWADRSTQQSNRGLFKNNKTGMKGVCFNNTSNAYTVTMTINGKQRFLGNFDKLEDALKARELAEKIIKFL